MNNISTKPGVYLFSYKDVFIVDLQRKRLTRLKIKLKDNT